MWSGNCNVHVVYPVINVELPNILLPSPTGDILFHNGTLTVYNCFGQTVKEIKNISGQTVTLQRDNLPIGLYFVRLTEDNKQIETKKIIITD